MPTRNQLVVLFVLSFAAYSCSNRYYYVNGLKKAQHPSTASVCDKLTEIKPSNKDLVWETIHDSAYVLAVTWKADTDRYFKDLDPVTKRYKYNTGSREIYVTAAPYLKQKDLGKLNDKKLTNRLNQLLGLSPRSSYAYFIEVWVRPADLIRPCFDPSIDTNVCEFSASQTDISRTDYTSWLYKYIYDSYQDTDKLNRYPFTHLGYTYDWSPKNKSHVGLSEFVIPKGRNIYMRKVYTTRAYFSGP